MTPYELACQTHTDASRTYGEALRRYRAGELADAEFLTARGVMTAADAAFDAAFQQEAERLETAGQNSEQGQDFEQGKLFEGR